MEISRAAEGREPVGYSIAVPVGWSDLTSSVEERVGSLVVDALLKPQPPSDARITITRSVRSLQDPAPGDADIDSVRSEIEAELGEGLVRSRSVRLSGEKAVALDLAPGADGLRSRQVAVLRGGQVLFVSLSASKAEWRPTLAVFKELLDSWRWTAASAR